MLLRTGRYQVGSDGCSPHRMHLCYHVGSNGCSPHRMLRGTGSTLPGRQRWMLAPSDASMLPCWQQWMLAPSDASRNRVDVTRSAAMDARPIGCFWEPVGSNGCSPHRVLLGIHSHSAGSHGSCLTRASGTPGSPTCSESAMRDVLRAPNNK